MEREIRAEVKRENRKAERKTFKKVQLQSDDRLVEGN